MSTLAEKIKFAAAHGIPPPRVSRAFCTHMRLSTDKRKNKPCCGNLKVHCAKTDTEVRLTVCHWCKTREEPKR